MKRLCIVYHMSIDHSRPSDPYPHRVDTVESCITTSFTDGIADRLLAGDAPLRVKYWLDLLAENQGYSAAEFLKAEEAPARDEN